MPLTARSTLEKARFFARRARETRPDQREEATAYIEAAIVFGRSVTFHLQKELSGRDTFGTWYQQWQSVLGASAASRYLLEQRNYVLKEGPLKTRRIVNVVMTEAIRLNFSVTATATVTRGTPWYRRPLRIIVEDLLRPYREWNGRRKERERVRQETLRARQLEMAESTTKISDNLYFDEPAWAEAPALDVLDSHLALLEKVVASAEATFGAGDNGLA